ncbi:MAG: GNAT family N-acetyltransferase [Promethearchaeota archaeon]
MDISKGIKTKRLTLRPINKDDFENFLRIINDKDILENAHYFLENVDLSRPKLLFKLMISPLETLNPIFSLIILKKDTNDCIGFCGFNLLTENKEAICFYYLIPLYRGSGFAIESVKKLIEFGFIELGLDKISIFINPKSKEIWKVAERCGLKYLGHVDIPDTSSKAMYFSIGKEEFNTQHFI